MVKVKLAAPGPTKGRAAALELSSSVQRRLAEEIDEAADNGSLFMRTACSNPGAETGATIPVGTEEAASAKDVFLGRAGSAGGRLAATIVTCCQEIGVELCFGGLVAS